MASLRKRHREHIDELPPERDVPAPAEAAAVTLERGAAAETSSSPAAHIVEQDEEKVAMRRRLQEMEDAQQRVQQLEAGIAQQAQIVHQLQQAPQQQSPSVEIIIANAPLPESAKAWLLAHPDYITDAAKNAQMQEMHYVAKWKSGGEQFTDRYFQQMETLLGVQPMTDEVPMNGSRPFHVPAFASEPARPEPPATPAPPRQVTVSPVSAPPHREVPSLSNGRRPSNSRVLLSADQREIAWAARADLPRQEAEELYAQNLMRMEQLLFLGRLEEICKGN